MKGFPIQRDRDVHFLGNHRLELDFPKSTVVFHPSTDRAPQIPLEH